MQGFYERNTCERKSLEDEESHRAMNAHMSLHEGEREEG